MNILVTGGAGFIGSHIVDNLILHGHCVLVVDNLSTGKRENLNPAADFYELDIRDDKLAEIFKDKNIDTVFHLAAQMDVRKSVEDPLFDADVNIIGGLKLIENCVKAKVKHFIFISSGGVMYGECGNDRPAEDKYPCPLCPYGSSKLSFEFYLNFYQENYGIKCAVLRLGNVYGPRQDPYGEAGVVAIFSQAMLKNKEVKIFGDGRQLRDYVYVEDVVRANLAAMEKGSGIYNIGTGVSESVNELFDILKSRIDYKKESVYMPRREGELNISRLSVLKAEQELFWKAEVSFEEGLKKTVEYFKNKENPPYPPFLKGELKGDL